MKRRNTKSSKTMNRVKIIAIVLLVAGIVLNATTFMIPTSVQEFDMYLTVDNYIGVNIDTSALFFGVIRPGGQGMRSLNITNHGNATTRVELQASGEMSDIVYVSSNSFSLAPGTNQTVNVTAAVPIDMPYGNYTGKLIIQYFS